MEVVMDNQELQNSVAKIAEALITTQTKSRHGVPISVGGKDFDTGTTPRL
jgi:hypothetical protein